MSKFMSYNFTVSLKVLKKVFDFFIYYYFLVDFYLLKYFSRKYPYCVFIFCYFFGTFGYTEDLSDLQFVCKVLCLVFSWYLAYISIVVFCAFNIPSTKKYLYDLLGKDFVTSKIGNPALDGLARFGGFAALGFAINEGGKIAGGYATINNANDALKIEIEAIEESPYLSPKQKAAATQEALKSHQQMVKTPPQGTLDRIAKIEAHKDMIAKATKVIKSIWGK